MELSHSELAGAVRAELTALREGVTGVRGSVLASADGLLIMHDNGSGPEPHDLAALAAASVGVGRQTALALRHGAFQESTVRSHRGYFAVYAVADLALLAVVGDDGMNVARLHLEARAVTPRLVELLQAARSEAIPDLTANARHAELSPLSTGPLSQRRGH